VILRIAFRNMLRQKRRTALTLLTIFGGFTLAAISIGWSDGTYSYIINMFTRNRLGHIEIHKDDYLDRPSIYKRIQNYQEIGGRIRRIDGVEAWAPRVLAAGLAALKDKTAAVQLIGMDAELEESATGFSKNIVQGEWLSNGESGQVLVGKELARNLKAKLGDKIVIVSQGADGSLANDIFNLGGIVETGDETVDRMGFYLNLADAQQLLVTNDEVHEIIVIIHDLKRIDPITRDIRNSLDDPTLDVQPWQVFAKSFYDAMKADREGMWIMLGVIILVVAVGVLNTVLMSVLERRREYGLLKAVGTRPEQIVQLVLAEVGLIAFGGVIAGAALSIAVNWILSIHGISLPVSMTYGGASFTHMYSQVNARSLYLPAITVFLSAILVALAPAVKAARTEPAEAMRTF
jgi:ABC-type lipoprotein release transport system permease subunit